MARRREREDYAPEEEPDRADVSTRLDKMLEDLAEVREKSEQVQETAEDIERTRREIVERRGQIREREAEIREKVEIVEQRAEESRAKTTEIRTTAETTRQRAEEVKTQIEVIRERREAVNVPPPDIFDKIGAGVTALEKPFSEVSRGLRERAGVIRSGGDRLPTSGVIYTSAERAKRTPQAIREGLGLSLRAGASAFDAFTMPVRPVLLGETIVTTAKLVVDAPTRKAFMRSAAEDPAGFGADIIGGAVGGYALGYGVGRVRRYYTSKKYLLDVPDEMFLVPEEAGYAYPQPETMTRTTAHDYLRKVGETGIVDDFDGYRGPITFDKKVQGFRRTGAELLPELVPDQAPTSSIYRPGRTTFIETIDAFRPGIRAPLRPRITPPGVPLAFTTGLGIISSLKPPKEVVDPSELFVDVVEEARIMTGGTTRRRTRPKPTPPEYIEAPRIIEFGGTSERERDLIAPMFRMKHRVRIKTRMKTVLDVAPTVTQRQREKETLFFPGWPTTYRRPRADPRPVYRPEMAKTALKRGRGSWRWFGEYRTYLKGDPLKMLEGF